MKTACNSSENNEKFALGFKAMRHEMTSLGYDESEIESTIEFAKNSSSEEVFIKYFTDGAIKASTDEIF